MKYIASVIKKSALDRLWKSKAKHQSIFGGNEFNLTESIYICNDIKHLPSLLHNRNFKVEAFGQYVDAGLGLD